MSDRRRPIPPSTPLHTANVPAIIPRTAYPHPTRPTMLSPATSRRDFLRVGGLGLCGVGLLDVIRPQAPSPAPKKAGKAKPLIVCWLGGGPPHLDMFDVKPNAPEDYRGPF